jgi:hypothetical protein
MRLCLIKLHWGLDRMFHVQLPHHDTCSDLDRYRIVVAAMRPR